MAEKHKSRGTNINNRLNWKPSNEAVLEGEEHFILPKDAETVQRASK